MLRLRAAAARLAGLIGPRDALLLVWFYLHLLIFVEPHLIYQVRSPVFSLAPGFIDRFLRYSGGPAEYVSLFLAQGYAFDWLGALLLTGEALLIGCLTHACFRALAGRPVPAVRLLPMALFILASCQYNQLVMTGPALIAVLAGVLLFARCLPWRWPARLAAYLFLFTALYFGALGACGKLGLVLTAFLFTTFCALLEACRPKEPARALRIVLFLLSAAAIVWVGEMFLLVGQIEEWSYWYSVPPARSPILFIALCLFFPLGGLWVALGVGGRLARLAQALRGRRTATGGRQARAVSPSAPSARDARLLWLLQTAGCVWLVSALAVYGFADSARKRSARIDYYVMHRMWGRVLDAAVQLPPAEYTMDTCHDVNTALFFTGRLAGDMFHYPQNNRKMMLPLREDWSVPYLYRLTEMYLRLGRINDAEHFACEAHALHGDHPDVLRQLALIQMVKGQLPAPRIFLNRLRCDLLQGGWARHYLDLLARDPSLSSDAEIQQLRSVMLLDDDVADVMILSKATSPGKDPPIRLDREKMLLNLLKRNPHNRMAFEYLMGLYLLDGRPDQVAANIGRLDDVGIRELPASYEEALAVYLCQSPHGVNLHGRRVAPETIERFKRLGEVIARYGGDRQQAYAQLDDSDAKSYFSYFALHTGGAPR